MAAGGAMERLPTAAGALGGQPPGLLSMERYCDGSARLVLEQVERLAGALAASARDDDGNAQVLGKRHWGHWWAVHLPLLLVIWHRSSQRALLHPA